MKRVEEGAAKRVETKVNHRWQGTGEGGREGQVGRES